MKTWSNGALTLAVCLTVPNKIFILFATTLASPVSRDLRSSALPCARHRRKPLHVASLTPNASRPLE